MLYIIIALQLSSYTQITQRKDGPSTCFVVQRIVLCTYSVRAQKRGGQNLNKVKLKLLLKIERTFCWDMVSTV